MYNKLMFYNSIYHLDNQGVEQKTRELITLLKPYLDGVI